MRLKEGGKDDFTATKTLYNEKEPNEMIWIYNKYLSDKRRGHQTFELLPF